jgi:hypothetical protein
MPFGRLEDAVVEEEVETCSPVHLPFQQLIELVDLLSAGLCGRQPA